eukprot:GFUD01019368.1.p1 GENE.GFUD01019368.1~~GFUD01019368.1.p1  ORF type:complete len:295 (+),score=67.15 GFUD01019368.1:41-925(+)
MAEQYSLNWNNYKFSMTESLKTIIQEEDFVDVTLHTEGKTLKAHKVYLSACSTYFKNVLKGTNLWQHPILFLVDVPFQDLQKILEFVYYGEVQVAQKRLQSFLKSAEILKISGLIDKVPQSYEDIAEQVQFSKFPKKKKRRKDSIEASDDHSNATENSENVEYPIKDDPTGNYELTEQVVVKADPEDFHNEDTSIIAQSDTIEDDSSANRGIVIRNDLISPQNIQVLQGPMYGERGRCHFCSLLCPDRSALTEHLTKVHQPPKHSLCENCENFFHICAIQRHRQKCKARYQTDR